MAISLKHKFTSAKTDGPDTTRVRPSNWNDQHDLTMATARLLGRTTAGTGAAEEISVGAGLTLGAGALTIDPTVTGNITTLQGQMTTAQGNITTLQGNITTLQGVDTSLAADITALQNYDAAQKILLKLWDSNQSHELQISAASDLTANRTLQIITGDQNRVLDLTTGGGGAGAWTLLNVQSPSAASSVVFNSTYITTTYDHYVLVFEALGTSGTGITLNMDVSINNGSSYLNSGYTSGYNRLNSTTTMAAGTSATNFLLSGSGNGNSGALGSFSGNVDIFLHNTSFVSVQGRVQHDATTDICQGIKDSGSTRINNIRVNPSSGTVTGKVKLFGVQKS